MGRSSGRSKGSRPQKRGGSRSSRTWGMGCGGRRGGARNLCADERRFYGRRSRVVLTPRRWRQVFVGSHSSENDGGKQARSPRRARRKPLKPLRREGRVFPANLW